MRGRLLSPAIIGFLTIGLVVGFMVYSIWPSEDQPVNSWSLPLSGQVIILDSGHGGVDGGAVAKDGGLEKDIALQVSYQLRDYLQEAGALVKMTREGDYDLADEDVSRYRQRKIDDLKARKALINESDADFFISLHLNAIPQQQYTGAQTFYYPTNEDSERLAKHVQEALVTDLENTTRQAKGLSNIYLLKEAEIPGILSEIGFLSNPEEAKRLQQPSYQNQVAASIYRGMLRYASGEEAK
ncbi:N-acetylmuramoyl-L-alanine amidase CwlD [Salsuginibacillus kocurii]|uniref:N-acetylmuramoyl-L-alanine amidase CwlD n=1 Tax=Salsuginibacillus kocurii TaxID=427078 RepID=UPI00035D0FE9|nr:N-acetylmuramoyl-L-alanine amidase CwlD [Salsuginibacillus kocurii]